MKIRQISEIDYDDVLALNAASVPHVNHISRDDLHWFDTNAACVLVARIERQFAGFLVGLRPGTGYQSSNYKWFCDNYSDFAYVDRVAVDESSRRQGVAEALYEAFSKSERDAPVMTCEVNIRPPNEGSMRFHQRLGFRQVASQEVDGGNKEVAMMEKIL